MATTSDPAMVTALSSDALFRTWGRFISDGLTAAGWVKTADSGQIDWSTVSKPGSINTVAGYEIWRMADSLQATYPVYMKLEFGTSGSTTVGGIWYTVGTGSDGSGTITAATATTTRRQIATSGGHATSVGSVTSGDTNRFCVVHGWDQTNAGLGNLVLVFSIERTKDASGADTGTGVLIIGTTGIGTTHHQQYYPLDGPAQTVETTLSLLIPANGTGTDGSSIATYPIFFNAGVFTKYGMNLLGMIASNFTMGVPVSLSVYGANRTYLPLQSTTLTGVAASNRNGGSSATTSYLMRYE